MDYDNSMYRTREWFESLTWQHPWIEKMAGWWVGEFGRPRLVYDFGAGDGWWCKAFNDMGATAYAIELDEIAREFIPPQVYSIISDIRLPMDVAKKADLVICLEVIEHIPRHDVENTLLKTLIYTTEDLLMISAAQPGQEGTGHINLQQAGYWVQKIEQHGRVLYSPERTARAKRAFENITNEQFHFLSQNLLVFARV